MENPLKSTCDLLRSAYPFGIVEEEYIPLLFFLSEYLSEENIVRVIDNVFPDAARLSTLNDVLKAKFNAPNYDAVVDRLTIYGLKDWIDEDM